MEFSFAQVESALAATYDIATTKRSAFTARLQHLQKLSFPKGTNTGRGRPARYDAGHLFQLGVCLELLQLGLSPDRAIGCIEDDMHAVAMAGAMAARNMPPVEGTRNFDFPVFLYCDPAVLRHLMEEPETEDWTSQTFFYAGLGQALEQFKDWFTSGVPRMAFFSVTRLIYDLAVHSVGDGEPLSIFYSAIEEWADPIIHGTGDDHGDD